MSAEYEQSADAIGYVGETDKGQVRSQADVGGLFTHIPERNLTQSDLLKGPAISTTLAVSASETDGPLSATAASTINCVPLQPTS